MKIYYLFFLTLPLLAHSFPAADEKSSISLEHLDDVALDNEHAETEGDSQIQKRSGSGGGSFDYISQLKGGLLSSIGQASASIASGSSGGSSGGSGGGGSSHDLHGGQYQHGNSLDYDPWTFKKSVLNTIFQAVKAITGGVTALKGQLIKGSGYALGAGAKLVTASGDKVTDVGKSIINSAQIQSHGQSYGSHGGGGGFQHPFAKFSSLSGASSGGSSGGDKLHGSSPGNVVHTETITAYEIPSGHATYGPPSKPPTFSSATHQYLPPVSNSYGAPGGAPFSGGHAAFEAPSNNYLPSGYGYNGHDDFNIYGRHKKLTDEEVRKAASQLQEILTLLPDAKTEITASKTVMLDDPEKLELTPYGLPNSLGPIESLSHTESLTAAYGHSSDLYHQMAKKQSPEEIYLQKHPFEGYDYTPPKFADNTGYKYNNYHANGGHKHSTQDLTPIIAALEVSKRKAPTQTSVSQQFPVGKNVLKISQPVPNLTHYSSSLNPQFRDFNPRPPVVEKDKYTYFNPAESILRPVYTSPFKVRRHAPAVLHTPARHKRKLPSFSAHDYEIQDPLAFNNMLTL